MEGGYTAPVCSTYLHMQDRLDKSRFASRSVTKNQEKEHIAGSCSVSVDCVSIHDRFDFISHIITMLAKKQPKFTETSTPQSEISS